MIEIKQLNHLEREDLSSLITGYTATSKYMVNKVESPGRFSVTLELVPLQLPYIKQYDPINANSLIHYQQLLPASLSFGAYDSEECVGLALAEPHLWNKSIWVRELHVKENHRRHGIGKRLVESLIQKGCAAGFRVLVCETQNMNVPAIDFYRNLGFTLDGIDLSYYTNDDYPDGEIAIFMKKKLV